MKLGIMQSYFFPYIGYFQLISSVDKFILYENLNFRKEAWMTRNRIKIRNNGLRYIHVPVSAKSSHKKISEISLISNQAWKQKLLKSIYVNYRMYRHFDEVFPHIQDMVNGTGTSLHPYNSYIITRICRLLDINTIISDHNQNYLALESDLQNMDLQDVSHQFYGVPARTVRAIKISQVENAGTFINAQGGANLYDKKDFERFGIDLFFLRTGEHPYYNENGISLGFASILDVLLKYGIERTKAKLPNYELF